jgi:catechol 2,3-dioxygenase-like lactoylglutathione lyase family enzyme
MAVMRDVTPFLRVPEIDAAIAFFTDTLGFKLGFKGGHYAYVEQDRKLLRLARRLGARDGR